MRKYWLVFTNSVATWLTYRVNFLWRITGHILSVLIIYLLWSTILKSGFGAGVYSQTSLTMYYLAIAFVESFAAYDYHLVADDIRLGYLSSDLVRPYNYYLRVFVQGLADKFMILLIFVPVFISVIKLENIGVITITLMLAVIMRFLIVLTIGGLAFWFNRVHGFHSALFTIGGLFSGELIPTDLLPAKLQTFADILPFKYFSFVPAKYLSGNFADQNVAFNFLMQVVWIIIWFLIVKLIWTKGLKKFESAGN